ncbi:MAG: hypothetical protein RLZZ540_2236 [Bacteroidota bacterium]|jgi:hypothetical protein
MQATNHDGSFGPIEPFNEKIMQEWIRDPKIKHVEVFEGTEENIQARQKLLGVKKRYQKVKPIKQKPDLKITIQIPKNKNDR